MTPKTEGHSDLEEFLFGFFAAGILGGLINLAMWTLFGFAVLRLGLGGFALVQMTYVAPLMVIFWRRRKPFAVWAVAFTTAPFLVLYIMAGMFMYGMSHW